MAELSHFVKNIQITKVEGIFLFINPIKTKCSASWLWCFSKEPVIGASICSNGITNTYAHGF